VKRITHQPLVRYIGGDLWRLAEEFYYRVGSEDSGDIIIVPIGTITDFASIPWAFRGIYPKAGPYLPAAILHDYLCETRLRPSYEAHAIFREAMEVLEIPKLRREMFYRAVLWFGPRFDAVEVADVEVTGEAVD
jgi:hypothetical protein